MFSSCSSLWGGLCFLHTRNFFVDHWFEFLRAARLHTQHRCRRYRRQSGCRCRLQRSRSCAGFRRGWADGPTSRCLQAWVAMHCRSPRGCLASASSLARCAGAQAWLCRPSSAGMALLMLGIRQRHHPRQLNRSDNSTCHQNYRTKHTPTPTTIRQPSTHTCQL